VGEDRVVGDGDWVRVGESVEIEDSSSRISVVEEAGLDNLVVKSKLLSGYLHFILNDINSKQEGRLIEIITPANEKERGCQVSMLILERGKEIFNELSEQGVVADWREPNVIRIAAVPLYNTFEDVWRFGEIIRAVI